MAMLNNQRVYIFLRVSKIGQDQYEYSQYLAMRSRLQMVRSTGDRWIGKARCNGGQN